MQKKDNSIADQQDVIPEPEPVVKKKAEEVIVKQEATLNTEPVIQKKTDVVADAQEVIPEPDLVVQKKNEEVVVKQETTLKTEPVIQKKTDKVADAQEVTAEPERQVDNSLKYAYKPTKELVFECEYIARKLEVMNMMLQKNNDYVKASTDAAVVELVKTVSTNIE